MGGLKRSRFRGWGWGFTLVELLIIVAVVGLIAAIAISQYLNFIRRAKETAAVAYMRQWFTAQELYKDRNGGYADKLQLINAGFLTPVDEDKMGYTFIIDPPPPGGPPGKPPGPGPSPGAKSSKWWGKAVPKGRGKSWRYFYTDQTGTIRYEVGQEADAKSPPI